MCNYQPAILYKNKTVHQFCVYNILFFAKFGNGIHNKKNKKKFNL